MEDMSKQGIVHPSTCLSVAAVILVLALGTCPVSAAPVVALGAASAFAALAGTTITNTGNTVLNGNVGVYPGTEITGFGSGPGLLGPGIVNGTQYVGGSSTGPSGIVASS